MRHALSVTSECAPFVKTGGLADVAGALPVALAAEGWEVRTLLPGYPQAMERAGRGRVVLKESDLFGGPAEVRAVTAEGVKLLLLVAPHLYERSGGLYQDATGTDWPDNARRFAALSWIAAQIGAEGLGAWRPEALHCHDWQGGFAPLYLAEMASGPRPGTIVTIHNMAFHGLAPASEIAALRLPAHGFRQDGYEFWGRVSALKAGLVWADRLTTVSPSYARELLTPQFGMGMDGVLRARSADLSGILNGIDTAAWDPATDPHVERFRSPAGKRRAKAALRDEFGLPEADGPLCIVVSRLSEQKGLDLLIEALPALVDRGGQLALLGSGDRSLEARFRAAATHPHVSVHIGYDEAKAHRMMAGADAVLVPSRFEPCGLTQLYGLRYGAVPIVAYTGGLIDTVIPATPAGLRAGVATGFQFHPETSHALATVLMDAVAAYRTPGLWEKLQKNGMRQAVGWEASAPDYAALYDRVGSRP